MYVFLMYSTSPRNGNRANGAAAQGWPAPMTGDLHAALAAVGAAAAAKWRPTSITGDLRSKRGDHSEDRIKE